MLKILPVPPVVSDTFTLFERDPKGGARFNRGVITLKLTYSGGEFHHWEIPDANQGMSLKDLLEEPYMGTYFDLETSKWKLTYCRIDRGGAIILFSSWALREYGNIWYTLIHPETLVKKVL